MNMVIYHLSLSSLCFMHMQAPGHTVAQKLDAPFCLSMCRRLVCLVSVLCSVSVWESGVFMHLDLVRKMDRICVLQQRTWKKNWITNPSAICQLLRAIVNSCNCNPTIFSSITWAQDSHLGHMWDSDTFADGRYTDPWGKSWLCP